jgi:hypothetical protein
LTRLSTRKIRRETLTVLAFRSYFSCLVSFASCVLLRFKNFETKFLNKLQLNINHQVQNLHLENIKIDIVGYKKRPRKTLLTYTTQLQEWPKTLSWQYTSAIDTPISKKNKARDFNSLSI